MEVLGPSLGHFIEQQKKTLLKIKKNTKILSLLFLGIVPCAMAIFQEPESGYST